MPQINDVKHANEIGRLINSDSTFRRLQESEDFNTFHVFMMNMEKDRLGYRQPAAAENIHANENRAAVRQDGLDMLDKQNRAESYLEMKKQAEMSDPDMLDDMNFYKATEWAMSSAVIDGASPEFMHFVRRMVECATEFKKIDDRLKEIGDDKDPDAQTEADCLKTKKLMASYELNEVAAEYYVKVDGHRFTDKGKCRQKLAKSILDIIAGHPRLEIPANCTADSLHMKNYLKKRVSTVSAQLQKDYFNRENTWFGEFCNSRCRGEVWAHREMSLFCWEDPNQAEREKDREQVANAMKAEIKGDRSIMFKILEKRMKEALNFKLTEDYFSKNWVIEHPDRILHFYAVALRCTDVFDESTKMMGDVIGDYLGRLKGSDPALYGELKLKMRSISCAWSFYAGKLEKMLGFDFLSSMENARQGILADRNEYPADGDNGDDEINSLRDLEQKVSGKMAEDRDNGEIAPENISRCLTGSIHTEYRTTDDIVGSFEEQDGFEVIHKNKIEAPDLENLSYAEKLEAIDRYNTELYKELFPLQELETDYRSEYYLKEDELRKLLTERLAAGTKSGKVTGQIEKAVAKKISEYNKILNYIGDLKKAVDPIHDRINNGNRFNFGNEKAITNYRKAVRELAACLSQKDQMLEEMVTGHVSELNDMKRRIEECRLIEDYLPEDIPAKTKEGAHIEEIGVDRMLTDGLVFSRNRLEMERASAELKQMKYLRMRARNLYMIHRNRKAAENPGIDDLKIDEENLQFDYMDLHADEIFSNLDIIKNLEKHRINDGEFKEKIELYKKTVGIYFKDCGLDISDIRFDEYRQISNIKDFSVERSVRLRADARKLADDFFKPERAVRGMAEKDENAEEHNEGISELYAEALLETLEKELGIALPAEDEKLVWNKEWRAKELKAEPGQKNRLTLARPESQCEELRNRMDIRTEAVLSGYLDFLETVPEFDRQYLADIRRLFDKIRQKKDVSVDQIGKQEKDELDLTIIIEKTGAACSLLSGENRARSERILAGIMNLVYGKRGNSQVNEKNTRVFADKDFGTTRGITGLSNARFMDMKNVPLFTHIPSALDIRQWFAGDCFMISTIQAAVENDPQYITQIMEDLGDRVRVRFFDDKTPVYVEVQKSIAICDTAGLEANALVNGSLWVKILEKAIAAAFLTIGRERAGRLRAEYTEKNQKKYDKSRQRDIQFFDVVTARQGFFVIDGGFEQNVMQLLYGKKVSCYDMVQDFSSVRNKFEDFIAPKKIFSDYKQSAGYRREMDKCKSLSKDKKAENEERLCCEYRQKAGFTKKVTDEFYGASVLKSASEEDRNLEQKLRKVSYDLIKRMVERDRSIQKITFSEMDSYYMERVIWNSCETVKAYLYELYTANDGGEAQEENGNVDPLMKFAAASLDKMKIGDWKNDKKTLAALVRYLDETSGKMIDSLNFRQYGRLINPKGEKEEFAYEYSSRDLNCLKKIFTALKAHKCVTAGSKEITEFDKNKTGGVNESQNRGVFELHAYSVHNVAKCVVDGREKIFVLMKNPHSRYGAEYRYDPVKGMERKLSPDARNYGYFYLDLHEFCNTYDALTIC